jgi:hypothetical protein
MTADNFCFYLQNRLIQTSQTGGQQYTDTSPLSIRVLWVHGLALYVNLEITNTKMYKRMALDKILSIVKIL